MKDLLHCPLAARWLLAMFAFHAVPAAAQDMSLAQVVIDEEPWKLVGEGYQFTEGPAVDRSGRLYFTDVRGSTISRADLASAALTELYARDTALTNGLMFGPDGRLYGCRNGQKQVVAYRPDGGHDVIATDVESNDLAITAGGGIYFTDPKNHRVWHIPSGGTARVVDEGIERPNGVILWPGDGTLVAADSAGKHLWSFRVEADGSLSGKQPYYTLRLPPGQTASRADGMTVDADGRLYVATAVGLQVFDPTGRMCGVMAKPHAGPLSNVVFAGPTLDLLCVTAGDKVFARRVKVHGRPSLDAARP